MRSTIDGVGLARVLSYGCVLAATAAIYFLTTARHFGEWDVAELQTVSYFAGLPHPTGFPLYVVLGWIFSHIVPFGEPAVRINLLSAAFMTASVSIVLATLELFDIQLLIGVPVALMFAFTEVVWEHSTHADEHDLLLLLSCVVVYNSLAWLVLRTDRHLKMVGLSLGLAAATSVASVWLFLGAIITFVITARSLTRTNIIPAILAFLAPLALYLYLPLRSWYIVSHGLDPFAHLAIPGSGHFIWNYNDPSTLRGFLADITGSQFGAGNVFVRSLFSFTSERIFASWLQFSITQYGAVCFLFAVAGTIALLRARPSAVLILFAYGYAAVPFSYLYANVEADPGRYRMLSIFMVAIFFGYSWKWFLASRYMRVLMFAFSAFVLASALATFHNVFPQVLSQNSTDNGIPITRAVKSLTLNHSIIVAPWMFATSLAYSNFAEGYMGDRLPVPGWFSDYASQMPKWAASQAVYVLSFNEIRAPDLKFVGLVPDGMLYRFSSDVLPSQRQTVQIDALREWADKYGCIFDTIPLNSQSGRANIQLCAPVRMDSMEPLGL